MKLEIKNRQRQPAVPSLLYFVLCFFVILRQIGKQNPKIIRKTVITFHICHRGQRSTDFYKILQFINSFHNFVYDRDVLFRIS